MDTPANMEALRIAICEDVKSEEETLIALISESRIPAEVQSFPSGEDFLEVFEAGAFDLIFLDVYMANLTGVQVAERIREDDTQVVIVFTTTSEDFTRESYRLNAYKYMLKPIAYEDVLDSLELAIIKRDHAQGATVQIVCDGEPVTIHLADIEYVEASNRRSIFNMEDGTTHATLTTIDALEKLLPSPRFLRSHRAFIVNLDRVVDVDEDFIMDNGTRAYIRVKDFRKIKHAYDDYLFNSVRSDL
ncbi:MAG: LytTR family DNA-binding domain-containing protein [Coriobacteriia bacterium]|jgi:DNA-binding LytR/AlgR family response regulator|nr:LytTR family DNA-binding domain-containing protein [Coriobacteriia bacterium]MDR2714134.1 LytTR family DNA-binding domain-containing protein [Coriobacteriales bacterium]